MSDYSFVSEIRKMTIVFPIVPRLLKQITMAPIVLATLLISAGQLHAQDIMCMPSKTKFFSPGMCSRDCKGGGLKTPVRCAISPTCSGFDDKPFKQFYNRALFGIGNVGGFGLGAMAGAGPNANDVLIAHVINQFFKPNNFTHFNLSWSDPGNTANWARVEAASSIDKKMNLIVAPDARLLSPAGLVNTIGHEMVHVEQLQRKRTVRMDGLDAVSTAFYELEATSWEDGNGKFKWAIGASKWAGCVDKQEKNDHAIRLTCYDWRVKKAIEENRSGLRGQRFGTTMEKYMNEDPWISQVWLKEHPDWKTAKAGPKPEVCKE
jgi:hypothetical protein